MDNKLAIIIVNWKQYELTSKCLLSIYKSKFKNFEVLLIDNESNFKKLKTITLTGKTAGKIDGLADITIKVPSDNTQRIQECHIMIGQILCSLVEESVLKD